MTEEQVRKIVRDEIEAEALKVGGIYDSCRLVAFSMLKSVLPDEANRTLATFDHEGAGHA